MSHVAGTVPVLATPLHIGPDSGEPATVDNTWAKDFAHEPATTGTKFVILHFMNVTLPGDNRLEVDLGYGTDVFTAADGGEFWTRPVNVAAVGSGVTVPIRYIADGAATGGAFLDRYGRGESQPSHETGHDSITNCDPFLPGPWVEPIFPHTPTDMVPKYDPFWICDGDSSPRWRNVRCASDADVRRRVARSVGMIVSIHAPSEDHPHESVSTCSVTLIDADLVVLAGHCLSDHHFEVPTSSVTFDFEVACDGTVLPAYDATFFKVRKLVKYRYSDGRDYAIVQLRGAPPLIPVPVRSTLPDTDEPVFGVHHPNGAVKKVSPSETGAGAVFYADYSDYIRVDLDVAGGSSGSGLFDMMGRIVGVLASGGPCNLGYSPTSVMLSDPVLVPDPPTERAVMIVFDRSGSMIEAAGDGLVKINEARDAAELFVSLLRASGGNEAGLVSFSTGASGPTDQSLEPVTAGLKSDLIDLLPGLSPHGATSIGAGLDAARGEFPAPGGPPRAILLLTDGMENTEPWIADVGGLGGIDITAIGFGTESNLDGQRLTDLAQTHNGFYKRAGTGLELRKFFALAFGEIFEAGALADPEYHLKASQMEGPVIPFNVCGEEAITVVLGWSTADAVLDFWLRTPSAQLINLGAGGIELVRGGTWLFARVPLPQAGERDGVWTVGVRRVRQGGGEFDPIYADVRYFVNVIARGGPTLRPFEQRARLYTGDVLHPKVKLQYRDETAPRGGSVEMTIRRPNASVGTALSAHGLGPARTVGGDVIPARQATLGAIEQESGHAVTGYIEQTVSLGDDPENAGTFMPAGVFGKRLETALVVEGNYTFHARARVGTSCTTTREVQWTRNVTVGIDPDSSGVVVQPVGPGDGRIKIIVTPKDRYGNHLGPGAGTGLAVTPLPGSTLVGPLVDLGDGRYSQDLDHDPESADEPGIVVTQPGRDPVVLAPKEAKERRWFLYTVKILCGVQGDDCCGCASVGPGRYTTSVTLFNAGGSEVPVRVRVLPTQFSGAVVGRWPQDTGSRAEDKALVRPHSAVTIDCCTIIRLLLGATPSGAQPITLGVLVLESPAELQVRAAYTVARPDGAVTSIDVEAVEPQIVARRAAQAPERPAPPGAAPARPPRLVAKDADTRTREQEHPQGGEKDRAAHAPKGSHPADGAHTRREKKKRS